MSSPRTEPPAAMCPACDYPWSGLPPRGACPECGFAYDEGTHIVFPPEVPIFRLIYVPLALTTGAFYAMAGDWATSLVLLGVAVVCVATLKLPIRPHRRRLVVRSAGLEVKPTRKPPRHVAWSEIDRVLMRRILPGWLWVGIYGSFAPTLGRAPVLYVRDTRAARRAVLAMHRHIRAAAATPPDARS